MNEDEREPNDWEIAQLILGLQGSALNDVSDIIDHVRRENYAAGVKAGVNVKWSVRLPGRQPPLVEPFTPTLANFPVNEDLLNEIFGC